jgi:DNA topoisomerase I
MEYLVIVESPSKCKKIQDYLNKVGNGTYKVIASKGHIRSITGLKSIKTKEKYAIDFSIIPGKAQFLDQMKTQIMYYPKDRIILATDNDREGEAIAFHICDVCKLPVETTKRILFNEITYQALREAVLNPVVINMNLVLAQHARQVLDIFIGFKISPLLWKYVFSSRAKSLSAGRCQTPALRLVYDNHIECMECVPRVKYGVLGYFKLLPTGGKKPGVGGNEFMEFRLNRDYEGEDAEAGVLAFLEASRAKTYSLDGGVGGRIVERPHGTRSAPLPLNTSRLLQAANSQLKMNPKACMDNAQKLYQEGLITYHRTESRKYCKEFIVKVKDFITRGYGEQYVRGGGDLSSISNEGDAMPHEAIRVTDLSKRELDCGGALGSLYKLIWNTTVESCMAQATMEVYHVELDAALETKFVHVLEFPCFLGWMRLRNPTLGEYEKATLMALRGIRGTFPATKIESNIEVTGFKSHYTESSLIQKLEDLGIGRPSTYAMFVETILERGYVKRGEIEGMKRMCKNFVLEGGGVGGSEIKTISVEKVFGKEQGKLKIEPLGIMCIEFLIKYFDETFAYSYTKNIEEDLDKFSRGESGKDPWYRICDQVLIDIKKKIRAIQSVKKMVFPLDETHDIVIHSYGPCVRRRVDDEAGGEEVDGVDEGKKSGVGVEYLAIKPQWIPKVEAFLMNSEDDLGISIPDLVIYRKSNLGKNEEGETVYIKTGAYGHYLECGAIQKSLKDYPIETIGTLDVETAMSIIRGENTEGGVQNKSILRVLTPEMSIRHGKFGSYIYYKKLTAKNVDFISLKGFDAADDYMTCDANIVIEWAQQESSKPKKKFWRGGRGGGRNGGRGGRGRGRV